MAGNIVLISDSYSSRTSLAECRVLAVLTDSYRVLPAALTLLTLSLYDLECSLGSVSLFNCNARNDENICKVVGNVSVSFVVSLAAVNNYLSLERLADELLVSLFLKQLVYSRSLTFRASG